MNDNTQNQQPVADNEQQPVISEAHDEAADIEEMSVVRPPRHHAASHMKTSTSRYATY